MPLKFLFPLKPSWFFLPHDFLAFVPLKPFRFFKPSCVFKPLSFFTFKLSSGIHHLYTPFATMKTLGETWFCTDFVQFQSSTLILFSRVKLSPSTQSIALGFAWIWPTRVKFLALNEYIQSLHWFFLKIVHEKNTCLNLAFWVKIFVNVVFFLHSFLCIDFFPQKKWDKGLNLDLSPM